MKIPSSSSSWKRKLLFELAKKKFCDSRLKVCYVWPLLLILLLPMDEKLQMTQDVFLYEALSYSVYATSVCRLTLLVYVAISC